MARATITAIQAFFTADGGSKLTMQELKDLKVSRDGKDYEDIANGIGDGTLTY